MMIEIVNVKWSRGTDLFDEFPNIAYCGLSYDYWSGIYPAIERMADLSVLGKPRKCIVKGDIDATLTNYRRWLWSVIKREAVHNALIRVGSSEFDAVACWCKPKPCHTEILLTAANYEYERSIS